MLLHHNACATVLHDSWPEDLRGAVDTSCAIWLAEVRQMVEASTSGAALDAGVSARYGMPGQTMTAAIQACLQTGMPACSAAHVNSCT